MKTGKKSAAELAILVPQEVSPENRLMPPLHISDPEREVWLQIVNDQPAAAFTPTHIPLLEAYCRHVVQGRVLADEITNFDRAWMADQEGLKRYDRLLAMHEREVRAASSLATRLRITRQAIHEVTAGRQLANNQKSKKPWEL
jgi:hypothetical protein